MLGAFVAYVQGVQVTWLLRMRALCQGARAAPVDAAADSGRGAGAVAAAAAGFGIAAWVCCAAPLWVVVRVVQLLAEASDVTGMTRDSL